MLLAILACMLLAGAPEAQAQNDLLGRWLVHYNNNKPTGSPPDAPVEAPAQCGELDAECCPPEDPDAPLTSAGPIYTCNDEMLFCRSTQISNDGVNTVYERICLECGPEGNACCPGETPCDVEDHVCAIKNDEELAECTKCEDAQGALNAGPTSPIAEACAAVWAGADEAPAPAPVEEARDCGDLDENCCPQGDTQDPDTEYTCNDPSLYCRSRIIAATNSIPPNYLYERLCLECGKEGQDCCPGESTTGVVGSSGSVCDAGFECALFGKKCEAQAVDADEDAGPPQPA